MTKLEQRQADMRARKARRAVKRARPENPAIIQAVQILHDALEAKPKADKPRQARLPKWGKRPCTLHPDDLGYPSDRRRCGQCKTVYNRARSAVYGYTLGTRYGATRAAARKRGLDFTITLAEYKHLVSQPCVYQCTSTSDSGEIIRIGLDRIDSNKGYTIDNVQPCCARHNLFKSDFLNHEQALDAVYRYRIVCGNTMGGRHRLNSQIPVVG